MKHLKHFDEFQPHTLVKHAILSAYLSTWAMKLLQWGKAGHSVYFVDAFAGEGRDKKGNDGSPIIAARVAAQTQGHLRGAIPDARMRVIAIEKGAARSKALREYMAPFAESDPGLVTVLHGELKDHMDSIAAETGNAPTLYFLSVRYSRS